MTLFFDSIADTYNIDKASLVYEYISLKTKSHDKGSKARRSLGNLYALYVVCEDFLKGNEKGSSFTTSLYQSQPSCCWVSLNH